MREERLKYLTDEKRVKAVTVCFTDLEGRLHMLDYDKKFLVKSWDNLTFDGSSIRGFTAQRESDLRLGIDWAAFYWPPSDVFGTGKVLVFGEVIDTDGSAYTADIRGRASSTTPTSCSQKDGYTSERGQRDRRLPVQGPRRRAALSRDRQLRLRQHRRLLPFAAGRSAARFIDTAAEVQRAMGFENEKDHPEVAPSQFEINYSYAEALVAADQIQLYKLICRQVAQKHGPHGVLPAQAGGGRQRQRHAHERVDLEERQEPVLGSRRAKRTDRARAGNSSTASSRTRNDICLLLNASVNAYRRLDPHFEAPNQIKASAVDRGSMVRIPIGNERSARVEVRSVAPDANPYMVIYAMLRTGLEGPVSDASEETKRSRTRFLPGNIHDALRIFKASKFAAGLLDEDVRDRYADLKQASAERCPKELGTLVKAAEVQFHHEVTNQHLWNMF